MAGSKKLSLSQVLGLTRKEKLRKKEFLLKPLMSLFEKKENGGYEFKTNYGLSEVFSIFDNYSNKKIISSYRENTTLSLPTGIQSFVKKSPERYSLRGIVKMLRENNGLHHIDLFQQQVAVEAERLNSEFLVKDDRIKFVNVWGASLANHPRIEHEFFYGLSWEVGTDPSFSNGVWPGDEWGCQCQVFTSTETNLDYLEEIAAE